MCPNLFVCLFGVNKTRAVKPLRRFHSWILSFTTCSLVHKTVLPSAKDPRVLSWSCMLVCLYAGISSTPFAGLFILGSSGHYQCNTDLLPLPISASPHHTHALHHANSYGCDDRTISHWLPRHLKCERRSSECDEIPAYKHTSILRVRAAIFRV